MNKNLKRELESLVDSFKRDLNNIKIEDFNQIRDFDFSCNDLRYDYCCKIRKKIMKSDEDKGSVLTLIAEYERCLQKVLELYIDG